MADTTDVKVLNKWTKFGPGCPEEVQVHLRVVLYDNQYFLELRDYFPERDHYGEGYLLAHAGRVDPQEEALEISTLIDTLKDFSR